MIVAPALMLAPAADAFRLASRPAPTNPPPTPRQLGQAPPVLPPVFPTLRGSAGLKLGAAASRLWSVTGAYRPAAGPKHGGWKIRRASTAPASTTHPEAVNRAVTRQPAAVVNARPSWESYIYD